jgi:N-acetylneuraminic acid mutarotase
MPTLTDLTALVEKLAAAIRDLNLDGDEQEEYSTMLLRLQNQIETGEPSEWFVNECLEYFRRVESRAASSVSGWRAVLSLSILLFLTACGGGGSTNGGTGGGGGTNPPTPPSTANEWTWMSGSNTGNAKGVYGTLGTPSPSIVAGARIGSVSWTDTGGNLWLFGGYGQDSTGTSGYLNDLWEFNVTSKAWTWVSGSNTANAQGVYGTQGNSSSSNVPGGRSNAVSWIDKNGNLWLFGGTVFLSAGNSVPLNDLWEYSPSTKSWTWVSGSNIPNAKGVYGTPGVGSTTNVPGARVSSTSWTDPNGNLWLFGGEGFDGTAKNGNLNDLWEFSPTSKEWTWMSGSSVANVSGVYGTKGTASTANVPGARSGSMGWMDTQGNFWLFGGSSVFISDHNDLWEFNPSAKTWTWISGSNTSGQVVIGVYGTLGTASTANLPGSRCLGVSWIDSNGNLWLFGGQGYDSTGSANSDLNDLWRFSPSTTEWTWMGGSNVAGSQAGQPGVYGTLGVPSSSNIPGGRDSAVGWTDTSGNFWLFGGQGIQYYNDLWRYQP